MGLDGGDYSGAWDLLEKENSFTDIAEIAVIEVQERKAEPSEPAPLTEPATEPEVPLADIAEPARDIADPVTADGEDGAFDSSEFDPEDVLEGEGDSGENDTKHTQNRVPPHKETPEEAPSGPERTSSVPVESDGIKKVSDRAILKTLIKLRDAIAAPCSFL